MTRNITIYEGTVDDDNHVEIGFMHDGEWTVVFQDWMDWSQGDLTDWLRNRLDAPMTVSEAIEDDRVYVQHRDDEFRDTEIGGFDDDEVARATYDSDTAEWTVELLS
jgi:hypothetical protein